MGPKPSCASEEAVNSYVRNSRTHTRLPDISLASSLSEETQFHSVFYRCLFLHILAHHDRLCKQAFERSHLHVLNVGFLFLAVKFHDLLSKQLRINFMAECHSKESIFHKKLAGLKDLTKN